MPHSPHTFFQLLDQATTTLSEELEISYMEALIENGENILDNKTVRIEDNLPTEKIVSTLEEFYQKIDLDEMTAEEIRQGIQLNLLKAVKEDYLQANHQLTPDSIGSLVAYLIEVIASPKDHLHLADLVAGTGNLLFTVYYFLNSGDKRKIQLTSVESDELLAAFMSTSSAMQNLSVNIFHQDALQNLLIDPIDILVSDLPVGYYPIDEQAKNFQSSFDEGHSYSHFLLIEQGMNYLKEDGFGFYIVPSNLFEEENGRVLLSSIRERGYFQGLIQLPIELFKNEKSRKSILIVQKKGEKSKQAKEILLATAPNFKDQNVMKEFIGEINQWKNKFLS